MFRSCILILCITEIYSVANFCRTKDGSPGKCIEQRYCSNPDEECDGTTVCCPMMQRIVTPNSTPKPGASTTKNPPIEVTTKAPSVSVAEAKCEEYKHRVAKRASIITYVLGGTASIGKEFPHMAILGYGSPEKVEWLCGGSLISERFVLTAAHCLVTANLGDLVKVRLGELDLQSNYDDANPQDFGIEQKFIHPDYHIPSQYNDIALIKLNRIVTFDPYVAPICLAVNRNLLKTQFIATGWGRTELGGSQSDILLKVDLDYYSNTVCQKTYDDVEQESLPKGIVDETQICAGSRFEDKDTCQGDSGGPLQIRDDVLYLVGITSFGKACGIADTPAVYTRVSYYVPWIEKIVWASK